MAGGLLGLSGLCSVTFNAAQAQVRNQSTSSTKY